MISTPFNTVRSSAGPRCAVQRDGKQSAIAAIDHSLTTATTFGPASPMLWLSLFAMMVIPFCTPAMVVAQSGRKQQEVETVRGVVKSTERKGKTVRLKIQKEEGEELDLQVGAGSKVQFALVAKGDRDFFKPGVRFQTTATMVNNQLIGREFVVFDGIAPVGVTTQDQSRQDVFEVTGVVIQSGEDGLAANIGPAFGNQTIAFEKGVGLHVQVRTANAELIPADAKIVIEGLMRGQKFQPMRAQVELTTYLDVEKVFPSKKAPKPKVAKSKTKGTGAAKGATPPVAQDPFGLNSGDKPKTDEKPGTEKPDTDKPAEGTPTNAAEKPADDAPKSGEQPKADAPADTKPDAPKPTVSVPLPPAKP